MTDATLAVNASGNDAQQSGTTPTITSGDFLLTQTDHYMGVRFTSVPIAQGQVVSDAYVDLVITDSSKNDAEGTWYGQASDNPIAFTTSSNDITARTSTSATVSWTTNDLGSAGGTISSPNLNTVVQEIVNRAGWVKGNSIVLVYHHNSATEKLQLATYDNTTYVEPKLRLTYSGIGRVAQRGATGNTTPAASSFPVDMAAAGSITSGNWLIMRTAVNNSGTAGAAVALTVDDARNGSWTVVGPANRTPGGAANDGATAYIAYVKATNAYTNGDDVTLHFSPDCSGQSVVIEEWTNIDTATPLAGITPVTATGSSGSPSASITPSGAGQLVYGNLAKEFSTDDPMTYDSDTTNGTWFTGSAQFASNSHTTGDITTWGQYKIVTASGSQTWDTTITAGRDWAELLVVFGVYSPVSRTMAANVPTGTDVDVAVKAARPITATPSNAGASAKATRINETKRYATKVNASGQPTASMAIGGTVSFAGKMHQTSNSRLRRVTPAATYIPVPRAYQTFVRTASSSRAVARKTGRYAGKVTQSSKAKAVLSYKKRFTVVGATNKPKISSKAKATMDTTSSASGNVPAIPASITAGVPATTVEGWGANNMLYATTAQFTKWNSWGLNYFTANLGGARYMYGLGGGQNPTGTSVLNDTLPEHNYQRVFEGGSGGASVGGGPNTAPFVAAKAGIIRGAGVNLYLRKSTPNSSYFGGDMPGNPTAPYVRKTNSSGTDVSRQGSNGPPLTGWWDDATWITLCATIKRYCQMLQLIGGNGIRWDPENNVTNWDSGMGFMYSYADHTATDQGLPTLPFTRAQMLAKIITRGYQWGTAIYSQMPEFDSSWYQLDLIMGSFRWKQMRNQPTYNDWPADYKALKDDIFGDPRMSFFYGMCQAHADLNATGNIYAEDAWFYHGGTQYPGVTLENSLLWNTQGSMSRWSQDFTPLMRARTLPHLFITPTSWAGTDNAGYNASQQAEPAYSNMLALYRRYGMGGRRAEYYYNATPDGQSTAPVPGDPNKQGSINYPGTDYGDVPGRIAGMQAAANPAPQDSTAITVSNITQQRSGTTVTLTFTASHPYGMHYANARLYASNGTSVLGTFGASWVWTPSPGFNLETMNPKTVATSGNGPGFANHFGTFTLVITGASTNAYAIVDIVSAIGQRTSRRVQLA